MHPKIFDTMVINPDATFYEIGTCLMAAVAHYQLPYKRKGVPMAFFERNEKAIRKWLRVGGNQMFYRGPRCQTHHTRARKATTYERAVRVGDRIQGTPANTRRENATAVVFY